MKKDYLLSVVSLVLIPLVLFGGGLLFSAIDPDMAAGQADYVRNYRRYDAIRHGVLYGGFLASLLLWLAACYYLLKSKGRSMLWMMFVILGPFGLAFMAMLNDARPAPTDAYQKFVCGLRRGFRVGYEMVLLVCVWVMAFALVDLAQDLAARWESHRRGVPLNQILQARDASSGMQAFGDGLAVIYLVAAIYLFGPLLVNAAVWAVRRWRQ